MNGALPASAEVVVIGGGVIGVSALYHLAAAGCTSAILIEREVLGSGSTAAAAGGIRAQFSDELNVRVALECIRRFESFEDEIGVDIDFKQWGYLFLLEAGDVAEFERSVEMQHRLGVPVRMLSATDALQIVPGMNLTGIAAATFCPIDGYATPAAVVNGYAQAARRLGAAVIENCTAEDILVQDGRIVGVSTSQGKVASPLVICAAGVWSRALVSRVGLDLPVVAEVRHVFFTEPGDPLPHELPLTIDFSTGFYFHREGTKLLLGGRMANVEDLADAVIRRLPIISGLGVVGGWHGNYEMTPDHNALVGRAAIADGLLYATGFSGHGFQQSPVVGDYLARLALGRKPPLDLSPFSADRFVTQQLRPEANVI